MGEIEDEISKSTVTLDTQYYQKLCEVIIQQQKMIDIYQDLMERNDREAELKDEVIKQLKESIKLRDKTLIEYNKLKECLGYE